MNLPIEQTRALLRQFDASDWNEIFIDTSNWSVFLAKAGAGANPMRKQMLTPIMDGPASPEPVAIEALPMVAEHLGIFSSDLEVGQTVQQGDTVGAITVLDRITLVAAETSGIIDSLCDTGELVEYGQAVFSIRPGMT